MTRRIRILLVLALAIGLSFSAYKYFSSDQHERACGFINVFRSDFSDQVDKRVIFESNPTDLTLDFRAVGDWKTICLTTRYDADEFYFQPKVDDVRYNGWIGKSHCTDERENAVTVLLIQSDGLALARNIKLPPGVSKIRIETNYATTMPAGFRQCENVADAVARCAWINVAGETRCQLLFPK
jgi:hypothetical protein